MIDAKLQYLECTNFKSYGGKQRIGPIRQFTCIQTLNTLRNRLL